MHSWFIECGCESIKGSQSGVRVAAFANLHRPTKLQRLTALGWALSFLRAPRHAGAFDSDSTKRLPINTHSGVAWINGC